MKIKLLVIFCLKFLFGCDQIKYFRTKIMHCIFFLVLPFFFGGCYKNYRENTFYDESTFNVNNGIYLNGIKYKQSKNKAIIFEIRVDSIGLRNLEINK